MKVQTTYKKYTRVFCKRCGHKLKRMHVNQAYVGWIYCGICNIPFEEHLYVEKYPEMAHEPRPRKIVEKIQEAEEIIDFGEKPEVNEIA